MDEREELKEELQQKLQWVQYRQKMLNIMEAKLLQMKLIAEQAKQGNITSEELEDLNDRLNNRATQVKGRDSGSRRIEDGKILE